VVLGSLTLGPAGRRGDGGEDSSSAAALSFDVCNSGMNRSFVHRLDRENEMKNEGEFKGGSGRRCCTGMVLDGGDVVEGCQCKLSVVATQRAPACSSGRHARHGEEIDQPG
jgi:hypothetical protein